MGSYSIVAVKPTVADSNESRRSIQTRASSINRALDEIGDMWTLLILQEVFWGINTFGEMLEATGASRGILSNRLAWLQDIGCIKKSIDGDARKPVYRLTKKSIALYNNALMAIVWERRYYSNPDLDAIDLHHQPCGHSFWPEFVCKQCAQAVRWQDIEYHEGPGAGLDVREIKTRRRATKTIVDDGQGTSLYRNLTELLGDRWTSNIIALAYHGLVRFEEFHKELPVATNILSDRLKLLVDNGILYKKPYRPSVLRYEYHLTAKGADLLPYFITLLQWGDNWCSHGNGAPMRLTHRTCGAPLQGVVRCDQCHHEIIASEVSF